MPRFYHFWPEGGPENNRVGKEPGQKDFNANNSFIGNLDGATAGAFLQRILQPISSISATTGYRLINSSTNCPGYRFFQKRNTVIAISTNAMAGWDAVF